MCIWQRLLVALYVSLWTLMSAPPRLPLSVLLPLVYCLSCDAQTPLSYLENKKLSVIHHLRGKLYGIIGHSKRTV